MATKVENRNNVDEKQKPKEKKHKAKVIKSKVDNNILEHCLNEIDKYKVSDSSQTFCVKLKDSLDSKFNKHWNVFVGGHFAGACSFVDNTYMELMLTDSIRLVVFQSYAPEK